MREIREILFRGKCCTTGEWVEGFLGIEELDDYVIQQFSFDEYFASECIDQYSVKLETVGQYTGLKDLHGTRIFEGDVVTHKNYAFEVYYNNEYAGFYPFYDADNGAGYGVEAKNCEIIGNVFDNEGYERCNNCNEHETGLRYFKFCPHCGKKV